MVKLSIDITKELITELTLYFIAKQKNECKICGNSLELDFIYHHLAQKDAEELAEISKNRDKIVVPCCECYKRYVEEQADTPTDLDFTVISGTYSGDVLGLASPPVGIINDGMILSGATFRISIRIESGNVNLTDAVYYPQREE